MGRGSIHDREGTAFGALCDEFLQQAQSFVMTSNEAGFHTWMRARAKDVALCVRLGWSVMGANRTLSCSADASFSCVRAVKLFGLESCPKVICAKLQDCSDETKVAGR